jgi:peptidoglycan/xylan/chitin deacetylase (PgdA/CDA1 family)
MNLAPLQLAKRAISSSGLVRLVGNMAEPAVAILRYHALHEDPNQNENTIGRGITHSAASFEIEMKTVAMKFHPISLTDLLSALQDGCRLPRRAVVITLDDGYADNFEIAAPILNKYGIPACFYIMVGPIDTGGVPWFVRIRYAMAQTTVSHWRDPEGKLHELSSREHRTKAFWSASQALAKTTGIQQEHLLKKIESELDVEPLTASHCKMLTWDQVRALHKAGHIIGSHTVSHANSAYIGSAELDAELAMSKKRLEEELQAPIIHFSYPSPILEPHFSSETIEQSRRVGYRTAVTCAPGVVRLGDNPLSLQRVFAHPEPFQFQWALESSFISRMARNHHAQR